MRNPFRRRRPAPRTVSVTITADTSRFEEGMRRASRAAARTGEAFSVLAYRHRIAHERELGLAFVGEQLDCLCEHFGMDPSVWRAPRLIERQERLEAQLANSRFDLVDADHKLAPYLTP